MNVKVSTLNNGMRLVTNSMPFMESVSIGIWTKCGGRCEEDSISGISHFIEHMMFKGTQKRNSKEISEAIEGLGGVLNAFTSEENTCYLAKVPSKYFSQGLDVLADMVLNSSFLDEELEREKGVVLEEMKMYLDMPSQYVHDVLNTIMWPNHPLGKMILGHEESIMAFNRDKLFEYKRKYYTADNIVVAVSGKIEHDDVKKQLETIMEGFVDKGEPDFVAFVDNQTEPQIKIFDKDTEQAHLALGIKALKREHSDRYVLQVLNVLLGGNMSSRLFQEVREKNSLAYEIHSSIERFTDTGALVVSAGVEIKKLEKAVEIIIKEIDRFTKELVDAEELKRAKEYVEGQTVMNLEKTMNYMLHIGGSLINTGKIRSLDEIIESIQKVTAEDIMRLSKMIFKDNAINLSIVAPVPELEEKLKSYLSFSKCK